MNDRERALLLEQVAGAFRESSASELRQHAAWHDLDERGRAEAAAVAERSRIMEAALDPEGLSTTAHAVLARIRD